jgi:7-keto-8-aminopelargonate synthetase-like enzyme
VTDGVFSQDGDIAPIPDLLRLADRWDALVYVDDAHGAGVLGASGGGILEHFQAASDRLIYMATLSKAYGSIGGYNRGNRVDHRNTADVIRSLRFHRNAAARPGNDYLDSDRRCSR